MPVRDVIVVGASAGGVEALVSLVRGLPADLPAAVLVVLHIPPEASTALAAILKRAGSLPADVAVDGEDLRTSRIYVAPPDHHLLVASGKVVLSRGPRENGHRPAVDPLFRSAANAYGERVIGVVLSGALDDGTAGLAAIVAKGGAAIVQEPQDALHPSMPLSAIEQVRVDHVAPASQIGALLALHTREAVPVNRSSNPAEPWHREAEYGDVPQLPQRNAGDDPSPVAAGLTCPDCQGSLFEIREGEVVHYRCRVGHTYSPQTLLAKQGEEFEAALLMALRVLEDKGALSRRMAQHALGRGHTLTADRYESAARDVERASSIMRDALRLTRDDAGPEELARDG